MERDQPGGSSLKHRDVSWNGASTSYLFAQDQDLAETSTSSPRNLPIRRVFNPALQGAQARDQARDFQQSASTYVEEHTSTIEKSS
jgi:hypothetical protein